MKKNDCGDDEVVRVDDGSHFDGFERVAQRHEHKVKLPPRARGALLQDSSRELMGPRNSPAASTRL